MMTTRTPTIPRFWTSRHTLLGVWAWLCQGGRVHSHVQSGYCGAHYVSLLWWLADGCWCNMADPDDCVCPGND